jgi:2-dehydropantoate 2-reductase
MQQILHLCSNQCKLFFCHLSAEGLAGRPRALDALVGVVREVGQRLGVATPQIDTVYGLARLFGRVQGLYPDVSG